MTPEEAKARVAKQDQELADLEAMVMQFAQQHPNQVFLAILRALVEMTCSAMGPNFRVMQKIKFYKGVLGMLASKGIS